MMDTRNPAALTKANYAHYHTVRALTAFTEYPERSHFTLGGTGGEEITDDALAWGAEHAAATWPIATMVD